MSTWSVRITKKAEKALGKLPLQVRDVVALLMKDIETHGPVRPDWSHYGALKGEKNKFHCHVKSGRPTYVVCWEVVDKKVRIVEVYYAGTHEGAPY